ncbi:hypothetical protein C8Q76DRAFT_752909 [Earliella scabrosa]|nr:hypothetical protein C8Q76DRAFT_752909 [Earliella scabrosa]
MLHRPRSALLDLLISLVPSCLLQPPSFPSTNRPICAPALGISTAHLPSRPPCASRDCVSTLFRPPKRFPSLLARDCQLSPRSHPLVRTLVVIARISYSSSAASRTR